MQSQGWLPTLRVAWCLIWWLASLEKYGHTWHWMSLLRPGVIKQHKTFIILCKFVCKSFWRYKYIVLYVWSCMPHPTHFFWIKYVSPVSLVPRRPYFPHPLALCCHYPVSKYCSASVVVTSTVRVNSSVKITLCLHIRYYILKVIITMSLKWISKYFQDGIDGNGS